jgi:sarcosine oxidase
MWRRTAEEYELVTREKIALLTETGGLLLGEHDDEGFQEYCTTAHDHNVPHNVLSPDDIRKTFPQFEPGTSYAVYENSGGYMQPEVCIKAHIDLARHRGAELMMNTCIVDVEEQGNGTIRITTNKGVFEAGQAVLSIGAWIQKYLRQEDRKKMTIHQEAQHWFTPSAEKKGLYAQGRFPVFVWEFADGSGLNEIYGAPDIGQGVKIAGGDPPALQGIHEFRHEVIAADIENIRGLIADRFPDLRNAPMRSGHVCRFLCTPNGDFVIDRAPGSQNLWIVSPCSGKGFKHSAGIGDIVGGHLLEGKTPPIDISHFSYEHALGKHIAKATPDIEVASNS